ncbi:MAG: RNA polymerase sigma factor [Limisphaerales bacterium]
MDSPAPDPDAELMLRVKRGDRGAFEELLNRWRQPVLNFVARQIQDDDEAEDLAQHVFVQVWKTAARYEATSRFTTWLFTIARNLALNERRRRGRHPAVPLDEPLDTGEAELPRQRVDAHTAPADEEAQLHELGRKIEEALAALPEPQRTAILLFRDTEMSYEEIARVLRCSVSATKSVIHRGRETLKARLKPYLRTGAWTPGAETFPAPRG